MIGFERYHTIKMKLIERLTIDAMDIYIK